MLPRQLVFKRIRREVVRKGRGRRWSGQERKTAASDRVGGVGTVTIPPVQKSHPVTALWWLCCLYLFSLSRVKSALTQGICCSKRPAWRWHTQTTQASSPKAKPPLQFRFSWQRPTLELTSSPVMSEEIPHLTKDPAPVANKLNSLACSDLGPRIWWVLETNSETDSCCSKGNVLFWISGCLWTWQGH